MFPFTSPASRSRRASRFRCRSSPGSADTCNCRRPEPSSGTPTRACAPRAWLVRANVEARYLAVGNAYQAIGAQSQARDAAREQLRLARDRYRVGLGSALEVTDAQNAVTQAEGAYVGAVYDYHRAITALEAAVGRPLR